MADKAHSLLGKRPKTDVGAAFATIRGKPVTIVGVAFDRGRTGKDGESYDLVILTLDDESRVHTGSKSIVEYFENVTSDDLPATATFDMVKSQNGRDYWDIVA